MAKLTTQVHPGEPHIHQIQRMQEQIMLEHQLTQLGFIDPVNLQIPILQTGIIVHTLQAIAGQIPMQMQMEVIIILIRDRHHPLPAM